MNAPLSLAHSKITPLHLERKAAIYIRQSSLKQVREHVESQLNQRALIERAQALGWHPERIEVLDGDLGQSATSTQGRNDFKVLAAEVALGHIGIVFGWDVSRLARNNADWYQLLDLAALFGTLIGDNDGVYDPSHFNDRLLLGMKGTLSEAESYMLRQRLNAGRLSKVQRGEYVQTLPTGLVRLTDKLTHEVFEGNVGEVTTVRGIVERLGQRFCLRRVVFVADRGMLSLDTLNRLEGLTLPGGRGVEYIVAVPARRCTQVTAGLATLHPRLVNASRRSGAESVTEAVLEGQRRLVVAHDPERARPTRRQRAARIREVLALARALEARLEAQDAGVKVKGRRLTDAGAKLQLQQAIAERRLSALFRVEADAPLFCWSWHPAAFRQAWQRDGKLVLITNVPDLPAADIVAHYKALADIERGFRVLKSDLELAPVYHRLPERIRAHTSICFLALVLQRVLRQRLHQRRWPGWPQMALAQLRLIQRHRVRLPNGQTLTGISPLTDTHRALLEALHIEIPTEARLTAAM